MAVSRFYDPKPVYFDNSGVICAGGTIYFFEADTVTAKHCFAEPELSTDLGVSVDLDASGRLESPVFLSGAYCAQLKDADDVQVWFQEDLGETDASAIPALDPADGEDGQVYSTDGTPGGAYWRDVLEVPDCTGNSGKYLGTDGVTPDWESFPAAVVYDSTNLPGGITQGATSFQIGKLLVQFGTGTAPTAAAEYTSVAVSFSTAYATLLHVSCSPTGSSGFTGRGTGATQQIAGSTSGFTARFSCGNEHGAGDYNITTAVTFTWIAFGLVA